MKVFAEDLSLLFYLYAGDEVVGSGEAHHQTALLFMNSIKFSD